jgi:hypothetical protein
LDLDFRFNYRQKRLRLKSIPQDQGETLPFQTKLTQTALMMIGIMKITFLHRRFYPSLTAGMVTNFIETRA